MRHVKNQYFEQNVAYGFSSIIQLQLLLFAGIRLESKWNYDSISSQFSSFTLGAWNAALIRIG